MKKFSIAIYLILALFFIASCSFPGVSVWGEENDSIKAMLWSIIENANNRGQTEILEKYYQLTGMKLEVIDFGTIAEYDDQFQKIVDKILCQEIYDIPDIVELWTPRGYGSSIYSKLAKSGVIIPLDEYIKNSLAARSIDPKYFKVLSVNGRIYGFPINSGKGAVTYIRKDWLDNLGLKVPRTWDELYEVMKAFTYNDPDQNGKNDTYGYALPRLPYFKTQGTVYYADFLHDASHDFDYVNGKWVDGFVQSNFAKALERLRKAKKDGLIKIRQIDGPLDDGMEFCQSKCGITSQPSGVTADILYNYLKRSNRNAEVIVLPCIEGSSYRCEPSYFFVITAVAKNPQEIFDKFIDVIFDKGEGQCLFTYGVKDFHYKVVNEEYKSLQKYNERVQVYEKLNPYVAFMIPERPINDWNNPFLRNEKILESHKALQDNFICLPIKPYSESYNQGLDIYLLKTRIMTDVILGKCTVDQGIELYKQKAQELKVDQILKEFNDNK